MGVSKCQWIFVQQKISKEVVRTPQLELFKFVLGIVRDRYNIVLVLFQVTSLFLLFRHLYLFLFLVRRLLFAGIARNSIGNQLFQRSHIGLLINAAHDRLPNDVALTVHNIRSEERRVGKECRSRWSPYH